MREIKFRVWNRTANKWLHCPGWEVNLFGETIVLGELCHGLSLDEIGQLVALQYTGLKDRNGKEIYEGDILKRERRVFNFDNPVESEEDSFVDEYGEVKYIGKSFWAGDENFGWEGEGMWDWSESEVAGNIYENPDLLKTN